MNIKLEIQQNSLFVIYENNSTAAIRVWQLENSWGWENLSFIIHNNNTGTRIHITRDKNMVWTKNGPGYAEILPGQQLKIPVQLAGKSWTADHDLSAVSNTRVSVQAELIINETKESKELHVWTGKTAGQWLVVEPPHKWLLAGD